MAGGEIKEVAGAINNLRQSLGSRPQALISGTISDIHGSMSYAYSYERRFRKNERPQDPTR